MNTETTFCYLELENGEMPQLALYMRRILKGQDLHAWKADPAGFNAWFRKCVADYMERVSIVIVTNACETQS